MSKLELAPDQSGYAADNEASAVRIPLEGGASVVYADQLGASATAVVSWVLDPVEYEELVQFYRVELENGSLDFEIDLILDDPLPMEYQVKFVPNTFQLASQSGLTYTVTAQLEVLQLAMDPLVDEYLITTYPDKSLDLLSALTRLVNVTMPGGMG